MTKQKIKGFHFNTSIFSININQYQYCLYLQFETIIKQLDRRMGNAKTAIPEKIRQFSQFINNSKEPYQIPSHPQKITQDLQSLNHLLKIYRDKIDIRLKLSTNDIEIIAKSIEKTLVPGALSNLEQSKQYRVVLYLEEVYQLRQVFKNFNLVNQIRKSRNSSGSGGEVQHKTPETPYKEEQFCVICFSQKPEAVLPCAHSFCMQCTNKYISEKQVKLCPLCRQQFDMGRQTFEKQLYQVIGSKVQDEQFNSQFKKTVYKILQTHNHRQLTKILNFKQQPKEGFGEEQQMMK